MDNDKTTLHDIVRESLESPEFVRAVFSGQQRGTDSRWQKLNIRPVMLKDKAHLQFSYFDEKQNFTYNHADDDLNSAIDEALDIPFKNWHIDLKNETIQVRVSKKGKVLVSRSKRQDVLNVDLSHDRQKSSFIGDDAQTHAYLQAVGIMTQDGNIKANMQSKYKQISKFLELVEHSGGLNDFNTDEPLHVVDCGCGNAYLTFATYHYLAHQKGIETHLTGIDINGHLLKQHVKKAEKLGWQNMHFEKSTIIDFEPDIAPHLTIALHACDTATDEAIAKGLDWNSHVIICAPCCHHHLQEQLKQAETPLPFLPVLRHGILHERVGDVLTDSFRALILRILGYRTDIVQFIDSEHTPKNLMIRAVKTAQVGEQRYIDEYQAMKAYWNVTPYLESLIQAHLEAHGISLA